MRVTRLLRIAVALVWASVQTQLAYRVNMLFNATVALVSVGSGLFAIDIIFEHTSSVAGWTETGLIALLGTYQFVAGAVNMFIEPNLAFFQGKVTQGLFDDFLLRPVPSVFTASFNTFDPWGSIQVAVGLVLIVAALAISHVSISWGGGISFLYLLGVGVIIAWSYRVLIASMAFWAPGTEPSVTYNALFQFGRYPVSIYPAPLRRFLTYVVPVAFISTLPTESLLHPELRFVIESTFLGCIACCVALGVWRRGVRRYTSATS